MPAATLGLQAANTYEIAIFERDGHPNESNFQLTLSGFSTTDSVCKPQPADGPDALVWCDLDCTIPTILG
jgi:hypothetical protein